MGYYERQDKSLRIIKSLLTKGARKNEMIMSLMENGGLGSTWINRFLENNAETISEKDGIYRWDK